MLEPMNAPRTRPLVLHRHPISGHCHRVETFLAILGVPYELVDVDLLTGAHKAPTFLAMNAFAQVPVLVDGDTVVADSNAILVYLASKYADASWLPRSPEGQAAVQRWLSVAAGQLAYGPAAARVANLFGKPHSDEALARSHAILDLLEQHLRGHEFLAASHPTIADIACYAYVARAPEGGVSLGDRTALRRWLARIEALPGFVPMITTPVGLAS